MTEPLAIDVALVPLRVSAATLADAFALLDSGERDAAAQRDGDARRRYVVAHAARRALLAARLGTDPARVTFVIEPGGRPVAAGVACSLSHSGDRAAVAMAEPTLVVGVDLERIRARPHLDRLAPRVFTPAEHEAWCALEPGDRPRAFARRWTELEAVLKARGTGIAGGLASARVVAPGWSCVGFDAGAGFVGAVAASAPAVVVTTRAFRLDAGFSSRGGTGC